MRPTVLFLFLSLISVGADAQQPSHSSRFGKLDIRDDDTFNHRLLLNKKEVFKYEGLSIVILEVLKGAGLDYIIVQVSSGGIACPFQVVIVEVYKSGKHTVSEEFGSCNEPGVLRVVNGRVIVETDTYVAHPELLPKRELRRRERTKEVYTWYEGKLTKKTLPR